ncbi:MAG: GDP-mannose 4,6-dehydratase, partial [Microcystis sp.]
LIGDSTKAREKLGWQPSVTCEGLVKLMVDADLAALGINLNNGGDSQQLLKDLAYLRNRSMTTVD